MVVVPSDLGLPSARHRRSSQRISDGPFDNFRAFFLVGLHDRISLRPLIEVHRERSSLRSQIMTDKLVAASRDRILRVYWPIDAETSEQVDRALLVLLGVIAANA